MTTAIRQLAQYHVWYELEDFGNAYSKVLAIDVADAIEKIKQSVRESWGENKKVFFIKVQ